MSNNTVATKEVKETNNVMNTKISLKKLLIIKLNGKRLGKIFLFSIEKVQT